MEKGPIRRKDRVGGKKSFKQGNQWVMLTGGKRKDYSRNTQSDAEPEPAIFCGQSRLQAEGEGNQPSHITFGLQSVLPMGCARIGCLAQLSSERDIQQLMETDADL